PVSPGQPTASIRPVIRLDRPSDHELQDLARAGTVYMHALGRQRVDHEIGFPLEGKQYPLGAEAIRPEHDDPRRDYSVQLGQLRSVERRLWIEVRERRRAECGAERQAERLA